MSAAGSLLVAAPLVAVPSLVVALRPARPDTVAPLRLAVVRAAVVTGAFAVLTVELLGALRLLTLPAFAVAWLAFVAVAVAAATWRRRRAAGPGGARASGGPGGAPGPATVRARLADRWRTAGRGERLLAGTVGGLVLVELLIALLAEPNNFDSQTYHLPKVEHWVAQGSLEFWPTAIHRQVTIPPGAEYLLLHLRLFTGGDALYNLVQWAAGVGCLLAVARIAAQLGGGRRAQLLTAFVLGTTPMVALQATSTQTDLVCAAWVACVATLALDGLRRRAGFGTLLLLGAATGLTAVTKTSGLIGVGPLLLLWGIGQLRLAYLGGTGRGTDRDRRVGARVDGPARPALVGAGRVGLPTGGADLVAPAAAAGVTRPGAGGGAPEPPGPPESRAGGTARTVAGSVLVVLVALLVVGPFLARVQAEFGHPLGPPRLRESIPMERHDPPSVLVNALRIGHTALDTPLAPVRAGTAEAIMAGARAIGVDPQDRAITFGRETFPVPSWYPDEDRVAFPLAGTLALVGAALALARPARVSPAAAAALRGYATVVVAAVALHTAMIKWQPWGNRLLLYALVLAAPLAGLWLDSLFRRRLASESESAGGSSSAPGRRRSVAAGLAVAMLAGSALAGVLALSYGFPRRLVGAGSVFTTSEWDTRFLRRPQWADEFRAAADAVRASGARRVGLVQQNDNWEYPWWLLLRDADGRPPELVALQSVLPDRPPADPGSTDAIVCTGTRKVCADLVPAGWTLTWRDYVGYALPPPG
ncbi:hypothetical protein [Micromonospora sp. WMMD712]|uniref:hypothetical protein n=1 Tax=Micromonospora sp. WMMD712 TaxID=3016096 RepID=UPI00249B5D68|nr:hypothetical protein [Micromonospora sp. WMMD712]WFE58632.1 hypothetical protein O7633_18065 [Micromonospora sp. WMMD712]